MARGPTAPGHDDGARPYAIKLSIARVDEAHELGLRGFALVPDPNGSRVQADARRRTWAVQSCKVNGISSHVLEGMLACDRVRNQSLGNQSRDATIAVGKHLLSSFLTDIEW